MADYGSYILSDQVEIWINGQFGVAPIAHKNRSQGGLFMVYYKTLSQSTDYLNCRNAIPFRMLEVGMECSVMSEGATVDGTPIGKKYRLITKPVDEPTYVALDDEGRNDLWKLISTQGELVPEEVSDGQTIIHLEDGIVLKGVIFENAYIPWTDSPNAYYTYNPEDRDIIWGGPTLETTDSFIIIAN